jgi:CheY-like chemotaxis protein
VQEDNAGQNPITDEGRILVVDHEPAVRRLVVRCLERFGYVVLQAENGPEVLQLLDGDASIGVVVLDYTMPLMSGPEVLEQLWAARPSMPVVLSSGRSADDWVCCEDDPRTVTLAKPFRPSELRGVLSRLLPAPAAA